MTPSAFDTLVAHRRSIFQRDYTGEAVPNSVVEQMLVNAHLAPNHKMTEPWRFVVFTGPGIERLAAFQAACYKEVTTRDGSFKKERHDNLLTKPRQSSHIISVGMRRDPSGRLPEVEEIGAVFCAVENMYLTAAAHNVGCYLSTGGITYFPEALPFFGLEPTDRLLGFLHVGMPRQWPSASRRGPLAEKIKWVRE